MSWGINLEEGCVFSTDCNEDVSIEISVGGVEIKLWVTPREAEGISGVLLSAARGARKLEENSDR